MTAEQLPTYTEEDAEQADLTPKQRAFVKEYIKNPTINATEAVYRAGYNVSTNTAARAMASQNLHKPKIKREIVKIMDAAGITDKYLMAKLKQGLEEADPKDYLKAFGYASSIKGYDAPEELDVLHSGDISISWGERTNTPEEITEAEEERTKEE